MNIFERPHDTVGPTGVKWWSDPDTTEYAASQGLTDVAVWDAQEPNGNRTRVVSRGDKWIYESQSLDALCAWLDMLATEEETRPAAATPQEGDAQ